MRSKSELDHLRDQAIALRRKGKSVRQIREALGPVRNATLLEFLKDEPPPEWTKRPNAKDDLRAQARQLRKDGLSYKEIAGTLHVSKSSVSLWVRDLPTPARLLPSESQKRSREGYDRWWEKESRAREEQRASDVATASAEIGDLSDRKNTGDDYHGCLRIDVRRSSGLYRRIEGWASAVMSAA